MNKRFLSFIMVLCIIICMVPTPVQAEEVAESHMHNSTTYSNKFSGYLSSNGGNYYLDDDYTLQNDISLTRNFTSYSDPVINLCLNGHVLDFNGHSITITGGVYTLNICDCTGGIEHKYTPDENGRWIPDDDGTESVTCGALYNAKIIADNNGRYPTVNFNDIAILGSTGPAIKATESIIRLTNCIVAGNYGRVIECNSTNASRSMRFEPANTVFRNNYSDDYVMYFDGSKFASSSFTNCTIADNEAGIDIIHDKTSETVLRLNDCLVQNNKAAKNTIYLYMQGSPFIGDTRIENNINREGYAVYIENSGYGVYGLHFGGVTIIDSNYNEIGENKNVRIEELIGNSTYDYYFSAYANYEYPNPGSRIGISLVNVGGILAIDNGYSGFKSDVESCFYPDISYVGDTKVVITCDERVSNSYPAKYKTLITKYSGQPSDPTSIGLTQTEIELAPSNTYQLGVTVSPSNAKRPDSVNWSSSNENVATVNSSGVVTGVSNGTTVITASAGALTATCAVVVDGPAAYEVTLITNGGEIANGKNVTSYAEGVGVSLPGASDITKEHSEFMGWYADSEFNGDPVDSISNQDTGAKIYYAKWERTAYIVDATANPDNGGEVTGEGAYASGTTATVTAIANDGYYFVNWKIGEEVVSTATTYAFTVTTDCALTAEFAKTGAIPARPRPSGNTGATVPETPVATAPAIIPIATDAGIKVENCVNDDTCPANHFKDTSADAWYHDGLHFVVETGIMQGTEDGFKPFAKTDRATIVTVLYRLAGSPEAKNSGTFSDVESGKWYSDAIEWAAANGIVLGYGDDVYGPADVVTRQQMATIFYRFATYMGIDVTSDVSLDGYNDTDMISDYAYDAMNWSVDSGLINGTSEDQLSPQADSNRAQIATILMRFCEEIIK